MKAFPEFSGTAHEKLINLDEDWMKSAEGKQRWRVFIESCVLVRWCTSMCFLTSFVRYGRYAKKVKDHNFGSLVRTDAKKEYAETNTIFGGQIISDLCHVELRVLMIVHDFLQLLEYK